MTRTCLVMVYGPQNIIPAIAAVKHYGSVKKNEQKPNVTTIIYNPGLDDNRLEEFRPFIGRIIEYQGWNPPIILKKQDLKKLVDNNFSSDDSISIEFFKAKMGLENIDEIYYAHDLVGPIIKLCFETYPDAEKIIFGDGFGQLYDNKYLDFISGRSWNINNSILNIIKKGKHYICSQKKIINPINVVAILPVDWSGNYATNKNIYVIPKQNVLNLIDDCSQSFQDIEEICNNILDKTNEPKYLLLLSNFSDCNYISVDAELAFFENIVRSSVSKNASIIIKSHPLAIISSSKNLCSKLESDYQVMEFPSELNQYPIEFLKKLILKCHIIAPASSMVSLTYLYGKRIIYPINEKMIEQYFPKKYWSHVKDGHRTYCSQLDNLSTWDQKSILWSGNKK